MGRKTRTPVDGKLMCKGIDGASHIATADQFYHRPDGRYTSTCRVCRVHTRKKETEKNKEINHLTSFLESRMITKAWAGDFLQA
jgi:hypothetical protein